MKKYLFNLVLIFTFSFAFEIDLYADDSVNKSPSDKRTYNIFTLKNGIDVITVSDPDLVTSAATLSVGVGQFQDPDNAQGIAHFLEHMLFMGSKKYPKPNEYMQFIKENGGDTNAFTAPEQTTYLFSINSSQFAAALDRLSSSIKDPLFDPTMVGKEINAVNSEWLLSRQSDSFIQQRTAANTGNPDHPRLKLGVGNKDTLSRNESELLEQLNNFYNEFYSANLMKLVLVGKQSPKELKKLANKYFSKITNNNVERPITLVNSYRSEDLGKNIYIQSKVKAPQLVIEFPVDNNSSMWRSKPNEYIEMLLNSQEPNSLMSFLNEEGLIESGSASIDPILWGADGSAFISYTLTDKGLNNKNTIIENTFRYIDLIKAGGVKKEFFDELAGINQIQFEDYSAPEALSLAVQFAFNIYDIPLKNIIDYSYITSDYKSSAIENVLLKMNPQSARIYHISPNEDTQVDLKYADGGYRVTDLDFSDYNLSLLFADLSLPEPQVINLDDSEELVFTSSGQYDTPKKIYDQKGVQAFLSHTQNFMGREGVLVINLKSSVPSRSAENLTYAFISNAVFRKKHRLILQRARQRNGVNIFANYDTEGNATFGLLGRTSTQIKYASDLLSKFANFQYTERDLKDGVKALRDSFDSISEQGISAQLSYYAATATKQGPFFFSKKEISAALEQATLEGLTNFHDEYVSSIFIDIFSHGIESPDKIIKFAKEMRDIYGDTSQQSPWRMENNFKVIPGTGKITKISTPKDGVGMTDIYIYPKKSAQVEAQFSMINKLFSPSFFNELRSNQQLGYSVFSLDYEIHDYPVIGMTIVSDNTELQDLKEKMMEFQYGFAAALENVDSKTIKNVKTALLEDLNQKPENIYVEVSSLINDWEEGNYKFDTKKTVANHIKNTSRQDLVNLNNKFILDGEFMNVTVQIRGNDFRDTSYFSWENY